MLFISKHKKFLLLVCLSWIVLCGWNGSQLSSKANPLTVVAERWVEVRSLSGTVLFQPIRTQPQSAQVGTRLQSVGDTLQTLSGSTARLAVDTGAGFVTLSENTTLRIQSLQISETGGRLTRLQVLAGQARLEVRPFTHPDSGLEIETPAGWSGVRGTEFGVAVRPDGSTGVATLEGSVVSSAQGQAVTIDGGFQSLVIKDEAPSEPMPLTNDPWLNVTLILDEGDYVHFTGEIDPINLLLIEDQAYSIEPDGSFDRYLTRPTDGSLSVTVLTPLGKKQVYELEPR